MRSEEDLVRAAQEGDEIARAEVVRRNANWLRAEAEAVANAAGKPEWAPDLEDVAKDSFAKVAIKKYDPAREASLKTFGKGVVRKTFKNELRRRFKFETISGTVPPPGPSPIGDFPSVALEGIASPVFRVRWTVVSVVRYAVSAPPVEWSELPRVFVFDDHPLAQDLVRTWPGVVQAFRLDLLDTPTTPFPRTWTAAVEAVLTWKTESGVVPFPPASTGDDDLEGYEKRLKKWYNRLCRSISQGDALN